MDDLTDNVLEIRDLVKDFPRVRAVNNVSFDIKRNTVHCLVGENGAGKSTLIKILTGATPRSSGTILLNGEEYNPAQPPGCQAEGHQHAVPGAERGGPAHRGGEPHAGHGGHEVRLPAGRRTRSTRWSTCMNSLEPSISPRQLVSSLSVAKKQIVEIAKAVATESDIIIMDEPTAAISEGEIARLFTIIRRLREKNVTVIYISHRLDEIFELGDYVTVMRDGRHIDTKPVSEVTDRAELIRMMIGKTVFEQYTPRRGGLQGPDPPGRGTSPTTSSTTSPSTFTQGEIVGFYGLVGAGKTELARAIYGADEYDGEILFKGQPAPARLRTRPSRRESPWYRRRGDPRAFSPSSRSAATSP